ncbi:MAG: SDR family oxidoreductase [Leptolyngbyaceae cyanobacterium RM2_2_4]|nr:SDR family oxidoreductase [Leptolyngbyaceae cyanobacterium RM2_2_4]
MLPPETNLIEGDLADKKLLTKAAQNITHLYFHPPATINRRADFIVERDGLQNILEVLPKTVVLLKLSEIGAYDSPDFFDLRLKYRSDLQLKESGQPFVILRPTWFMEALPLQLTQGKRVIVFGQQPNPIWLVATKDYAQIVCNAIETPDKTSNQIFTIQGLEPITMEAAARTLIQIAQPTQKFSRISLNLLKIPAVFSGQWQFVYELMRHYNNRKEVFESEKTWEVLGKPKITFEKFVESL